jgi:DNA polymerase II large subunit
MSATYKYRTGGWGKEKIERVELAKETAAFVTVLMKSYDGRITERREAKSSKHGGFFDTWEAAKQSLLEEAEATVASARRRLEVAQSELGNIKGMKPPKDAA